MNAIIQKARELLDGREEQEAEHEAWRAAHAEELLNAETDALLARLDASKVKQRAFGDLIYKRRDDAHAPPPPPPPSQVFAMMSPELQEAWNAWADNRIKNYVQWYVDETVKLIGEESRNLVRKEIAALRKELAR